MTTWVKRGYTKDDPSDVIRPQLVLVILIPFVRHEILSTPFTGFHTRGTGT